MGDDGDGPRKSEKEKMLAGELYNSFSEELTKERLAAHELCYRYNDLRPSQANEKLAILSHILGSFPTHSPPLIEPPFRCDYGSLISVGTNFYANFGCVFLDDNRITFGNDCFLGPGVHLYAAIHPIDPVLRGNFRDCPESSKPITVGNRVWIGGSAIVLPGVTIGNDVVVGAGSVVTKNVEDGVVVAGNPARVIRRIEGRKEAAE